MFESVGVMDGIGCVVIGDGGVVVIWGVVDSGWYWLFDYGDLDLWCWFFCGFV